MHSCKIIDHKNQLCTNEILPCINKENGCPHFMRRQDQRTHLTYCPASVVMCGVMCDKTSNEETNKPIEVCSTRMGAISPFVPPLSPVPPVKLLRTNENNLDYSNCVRNEATNGSPCSSIPIVHVKTHENQMDQVNKGLDLLDMTETAQSPTDKFIDAPLSLILLETNDLQTNRQMQSTMRAPCGHIVHRSHFAQHYLLHSDVQAQLDGWIELRCPLTYLGCTFAAVRLRPNGERNKLIYNPRSATFATRVETQRDQDHEPLLKAFDWIKMPPELLFYLSLYLDDYTLFSLSKVSKRLNEVCRKILLDRMVVTPVWRKVIYKPVNRSTWKITGYAWSFPERAESIKEWKFSPGLPARAQVAIHLLTCPYFKQLKHSDPFTLTPKTPN